jgi:peptidoglycan-N-acetylmuramic acid deacetylase
MKKTIYSLLIILALFWPLCKECVQAFADNTISWGLGGYSYEHERVPTPPDRGETLLNKYNGIFVKDTDEKKVYLTFDLGYEAGYTNEVLDILKEHNIKGIFFLCSHYLKETDLVNRMINEGHAIGNHTDKHKDLPTLNDEAIKTDIVDFQTKCNQLYPQTPVTYFRPPKGNLNERVLRITNEQQLKTVMWSIAIVDWGKTPINATASANKITKMLHPGAIILLHITNSGTPEMLKLLIPQIAERGYTIASALEL